MSNALDGYDHDRILDCVDHSIGPTGMRNALSLPTSLRQPSGRGLFASPLIARKTRRCTVASSRRRSLSAERRKLTAYCGIRLEPAFYFCQRNGGLILAARNHRQIMRILQQFLGFGDRQHDGCRLAILHDVFCFRIQRLHVRRLLSRRPNCQFQIGAASQTQRAHLSAGSFLWGRHQG
jgi:hypothetical protein